jgi:hypothetical protein
MRQLNNDSKLKIIKYANSSGKRQRTSNKRMKAKQRNHNVQIREWAVGEFWSTSVGCCNI